MLGGRDAVVAACELDQANSGRRKLYLIDADLDFLHGKRAPRLKYLYRLKANNVENILISQKSFIDAGLEHLPTKNESEIRNLLELNELLFSLDVILRPLFVAYGVIQHLCPDITTTGYSVENLYRNTKVGARIDHIKVRRRIISLYMVAARREGVNKVRAARKKIAARSAKLPLSRIASGKDYLLPVLMLRFKGVCGYPRGPEHFKVALARSFDPQNEPTFANAVRSISA